MIARHSNLMFHIIYWIIENRSLNRDDSKTRFYRVRWNIIIKLCN